VQLTPRWLNGFADNPRLFSLSQPPTPSTNKVKLNVSHLPILRYSGTRMSVFQPSCNVASTLNLFHVTSDKHLSSSIVACESFHEACISKLSMKRVYASQPTSVSTNIAFVQLRLADVVQYRRKALASLFFFLLYPSPGFWNRFIHPSVFALSSAIPKSRFRYERYHSLQCKCGGQVLEAP